jgi:opacity protein-like surface antigen
VAAAVRKMPSATEELHMQHVFMRYGFIRHAFVLTSVTCLCVTLFATSFATAAYAQEPRGYVEGSGALSRLTGSTTSAGLDGEVGVKVAPNVMLFGNIGNVRDIHWSTLETNVSNTVSALSANSGLTTIAQARVPTWYSLGGARIQFPNQTGFTPYVFGGIGFARMNPSVRFLYQDGTTPSGNAASVGDDVTADIVSNGLFTAPAPTTSLMLRTGGGVQVPISKHLLGNIGYSVSRISADTPIHAQDFTFGLGIKF